MRVFNGASVGRSYRSGATAIAVAIGMNMQGGRLFVSPKRRLLSTQGQTGQPLKVVQTARGTPQSALDLLCNTSSPSVVSPRLLEDFLVSTSRYDRRIRPSARCWPSQNISLSLLVSS